MQGDGLARCRVFCFQSRDTLSLPLDYINEVVNAQLQLRQPVVLALSDGAQVVLRDLAPLRCSRTQASGLATASKYAPNSRRNSDIAADGFGLPTGSGA